MLTSAVPPSQYGGARAGRIRADAARGRFVADDHTPAHRQPGKTAARKSRQHNTFALRIGPVRHTPAVAIAMAKESARKNAQYCRRAHCPDDDASRHFPRRSLLHRRRDDRADKSS